jgi:hypothetical protein
MAVQTVVSSLSYPWEVNNLGGFKKWSGSLFGVGPNGPARKYIGHKRMERKESGTTMFDLPVK